MTAQASRKISRTFYMGSILLGVQALPFAGMAYVGHDVATLASLRRLAAVYLLASPAGVG